MDLKQLLEEVHNLVDKLTEVFVEYGYDYVNDIELKESHIATKIGYG